MKKLLFACYILIFVSSCDQTKINCTKFRTGKFVSHSADEQYTILERNDTTQIETNKITGHIFKSKIKWTSDCEYELTSIEESKDFSDSLNPIWTGKKITTKIIEARKDYCVYESSMAGVSMRMIDTLYFLK